MRWSELAGKEIINLHDGARLGRLGEADLLLDPETGTIESLLVSAGGGWFGLLGRGGPIAIPWSAVRRIGPEVLIVELRDPAHAHRPV